MVRQGHDASVGGRSGFHSSYQPRATPTLRSCLRCGREIILCNGFTLARDIVSGRVPIREHCGRCVTWLEITGQAESYLQSIDAM